MCGRGRRGVQCGGVLDDVEDGSLDVDVGDGNSGRGPNAAGFERRRGRVDGDGVLEG